MHQKIVPNVLSTMADRGIDSCGAISRESATQWINSELVLRTFMRENKQRKEKVHADFLYMI